MDRRNYSQEDVLRLAKRINNQKRSYLLVNPLQAKHMPVSPKASLEMMGSLGRLVRESCAGVCLVIGFAETATAIATMVASELGDRCFYIQTTREPLEDVRTWILFSEEHSHATEQKLCGDRMLGWIAAADHIIVVDDEFSTGKTLINVARSLKAASPEAGKKDFVAASVVNRVDGVHMDLLEEEGYRCVCLVRPKEGNYEEIVSSLSVHAGEAPETGEEDTGRLTVMQLETDYLNPRRGVLIKEYLEHCRRIAEEACARLPSFPGNSRVLVLGTEECMFPALLLGERLETANQGLCVCCHATTRSPIGISEAEDYPIRNGCQLRSLYEPERTTYLYNLCAYDLVVLLTDAPKDLRLPGLRDLQAALRQFACDRMICLGIGE